MLEEAIEQTPPPNKLPINTEIHVDSKGNASVRIIASPHIDVIESGKPRVFQVDSTGKTEIKLPKPPMNKPPKVTIHQSKPIE